MKTKYSIENKNENCKLYINIVNLYIRKSRATNPAVCYVNVFRSTRIKGIKPKPIMYLLGSKHAAKTTNISNVRQIQNSTYFASP
jgi:hypothetical protein